MTYHRKTKIVATLGLATDTEADIKRVIEAGVNVARLNFSHGTHEEHLARLQKVRAISKNLDWPVAILQDLSGPKIRIGDFEKETVTLKSAEEITLTTKEIPGTEKRVTLRYPNLYKEISQGNTIFLDDGKLKLEVKKITGQDIVCEIITGGEIRGRRGVNIPDAKLSISSLTDKDKEDLKFGIEHNVDFMALSFVREAADVKQLRKLLGKSEIPIVSKIETKAAIENIDEIIAETDAVMVARGDLAVEIPNEDVPIVQKDIIRKCTEVGKPVITATQMLDSMIGSPSPTRAEVGDVANAILDGTDAVMLSGETAIGKYPTETVETMSRIATRTEQSNIYLNSPIRYKRVGSVVTDAVSSAVVKTAYNVGAVAIVAFTESGYTARMVSRYKPSQPILTLTPRPDTFQRSLLSFGCYPKVIHRVSQLSSAIEIAKDKLKEEKLAKSGDTFIVVAGVPFGHSGGTDLMLVQTV